MDTNKIYRLQYYWKTHTSFNLSYFKGFISRNRFMLIIRVYNFSTVSLGESTPADSITLYMLEEPTGFVQEATADTGSQDMEIGGKGHASNVVFSLLNGKLFKGGVLHLSGQLLQLCNPKSVTEAKLTKGEIRSQYICERSMCVFKWKDQREVSIILLEFPEKMIKMERRKGGRIRKQQSNLNYNMYVEENDHNDQMIAY
ncbi:hypothetical protein J437_LFUL007676 [Ladona fulva]|uniref:Uncharacterized protein n=1 Tax=Ladona fulva TaxID=123851 RepID=A0A8K0KAR9_LADFU|nr:hypothetical protein J437_LFUL007676 [Ladona fulva]